MFLPLPVVRLWILHAYIDTTKNKRFKSGFLVFLCLVGMELGGLSEESWWGFLFWFGCWLVGFGFLFVFKLIDCRKRYLNLKLALKRT